MIDGSLSYHFDFDLDKDGMISFEKEITIYIKSINKDASELVKVDDSDFNKMFSYFKSFKGEMWVGVFDKLPRKVVINIEGMNAEKPEDGVVKANLTITYSDWNKPVIVEVPQNTTTIEELISSIMGKSINPAITSFPENNTQLGNIIELNDARKKGLDAKIKSLHYSMRAQAESFYDSNNNSYKGFCTSKGGNGAYALAIQLPPNTVYKCGDSVTTWASWSKLSTGDYFCVDSRGTAAESAIPQNTSCSL